MQVNTELELAWQCVENTGSHLFLTGKAGTGKTTFLKRLKEKSPKRMIVVAPTGIAAINAGGVTIHSFFQLSFAPYIPDTTFAPQQQSYRFGKEKIKIIRSLDLLVIDEVSMVRADLLDAVDAVLRRYRDKHKPFGGVQLLMIGDLQQLAPVIKESEWSLLGQYYDTPYFFGSRALRQTEYITIQLEKVYRQDDSHFLSLLNRIRTNDVDDDVLAELNKRHIPYFRPGEEEGYIRLTTHNAHAQRVNDSQLALLPGKPFVYRAKVEGNFPESSYPADAELTLKTGAQIMFIKNDQTGDAAGRKRYYNGKIGVVIEASAERIVVRGKGDAENFVLGKEVWENSSYVLNKETNEIVEEIEGHFHQYPVRLAWAITIHKSQGLTFERAIIDAKASFAHGQVYVALSRCKTLEGMVLESRLSRSSIICDEKVNEFTHEVLRTIPDEGRLMHLQQTYFYELLNEQFDYATIYKSFSYLVRILDEHFYKLYPKMLERYKQRLEQFKEEIEKVAANFKTRYTELVRSAEDYTCHPLLHERIASGARYFHDKTEELLSGLTGETPIYTDNKEFKKKIAEAQETLITALQIKLGTLKHTAANGFSVTTYLKNKAHVTLGLEMKDPEKKERGKKTPKEKKKEEQKVHVPEDILHPVLYSRLVKWRNAQAVRNKLPAYTVLQQKAVQGIANLLPGNEEELLRIPYLGKKTIDKYGSELINIVRIYVRENKTTEG